MAKRVEICGIDTGTLPKLSHEQTIDLLKKAQKGDESAKEEFIMANMRLVLSIVQRFYNKKEAVDDIFQVGCIGLIKAMDNFNTELNLRFFHLCRTDDNRRNQTLFARQLSRKGKSFNTRHGIQSDNRKTGA